jgi:hypothetical protein
LTGEQYQNWRDFALRMARVCYGTSTRPPASWILEQVTDFLDGYRDEHEAICNWDESTGVLSSVCDEFADLESELTPTFNFVDDAEDDWCRDDDEPIDYDELERRSELARAQWQQQFLGPVACCVRAGLDMATSVTGGVVGFTVADLKAMFPAGIPRYVQRHYENPLGQAEPQDGIWL